MNSGSPTNATVMIAEDEPKIAHLLKDYLESSGYQVVWIEDGTEVVPAIRHSPPDLLLLDLMLPGRDGMEICRELRGFSQLPIIMVTARVDEIDRVLGLELGADDYVCKPFSPREVVARVRANLRRLVSGDAGPAASGFAVDEERHEIALNGRSLNLTPHEFNLLCVFVNRPGRVFSRDQLLDLMYHDGRIVTDRTVDSHIKNIRRKIAAAEGDPDVIQSIYGVGYKFEP